MLQLTRFGCCLAALLALSQTLQAEEPAQPAIYTVTDAQKIFSASLPGSEGTVVGSPYYWQPVGGHFGLSGYNFDGYGYGYGQGYGYGYDPGFYGAGYYGGGYYGGYGPGGWTGGITPYYQAFGPGYYRAAEYGHNRFPSYSYRAPWYFPGPTTFARDTNFAW